MIVNINRYYRSYVKDSDHPNIVGSCKYSEAILVYRIWRIEFIKVKSFLDLVYEYFLYIFFIQCTLQKNCRNGIITVFYWLKTYSPISQ